MRRGVATAAWFIDCGVCIRTRLGTVILGLYRGYIGIVEKKMETTI